MLWGKVPGLKESQVNSCGGPELYFSDVFFLPALFWPGSRDLSRQPPILWLCLQFILPELTSRQGFQLDPSALALNQGLPKHRGKEYGAVYVRAGQLGSQPSPFPNSSGIQGVGSEV